jgi:hypothetical protein
MPLSQFSGDVFMVVARDAARNPRITLFAGLGKNPAVMI